MKRHGVKLTARRHVRLTEYSRLFGIAAHFVGDPVYDFWREKAHRIGNGSFSLLHRIFIRL